MHMADALVSPAVGGTMLAVGLGLATIASKKLKSNFDAERVPLMSVMGAFVFAAQMINFAIPATGSSGHIGGGFLLAIILGTYPAFLTLACVLAIQALFFADGGLLAYGCNLINMGFFTCFVAYPLIYLPLSKRLTSNGGIIFSTTLASVVGLQLGSLSVVLETMLSGVTELPFETFILAMQPIHLAIGIIEGILTGLVVIFLKSVRPQIFAEDKQAKLSNIATLSAILCTAFVLGGGISLLASSNPDGLEWSIEKTAGAEEIGNPTQTHQSAQKLQEKTSILPDYSIPNNATESSTSIAGVVGVFITLLFSALIGIVFRKRNKVVKSAKR